MEEVLGVKQVCGVNSIIQRRTVKREPSSSATPPVNTSVTDHRPWNAELAWSDREGPSGTVSMRMPDLEDPYAAHRGITQRLNAS